MDQRKFLLRRCFAGALSLLGFVTNAPAVFDEGLPPTIEEAHAFLGGTFQRYSNAFEVLRSDCARPALTASR